MQYSLKELRARKRYTQADMAKMLGISLQTYNDWENNFHKVAMQKGKKVAELLGVGLGDIFFEDRPEIKSGNGLGAKQRGGANSERLSS